MPKLLLIDGHALVFKMYYAFLRRPMINSKGADMSILYGFTKYLLELFQRESPTHVAVAFDPPGGTFRNQMYPEYKGTRPPTPQLIIDALEPLTELVKAMNIPVVMVPGFEADDVLGSIATQYGGESLDVFMLTPDKDYGQLIRPHVFQLKPGKAGSETELVGVSQLCEKWGIQSPSQVIDMLAICGDSADNVPGVKGVGEVGAAKLIAKYGTLENIYAHVDELSEKQAAMFREAEPHIALSKALVTIKTDMELPVSLEDMAYSGQFQPHLKELFDFYEFSSLRRFLEGHIQSFKIAGQAGNDGNSHDSSVIPGPDRESLTTREVPLNAIKAKSIGIITIASGDGIFAPVKSIIISDGENSAVATPEEAKALLEDESVEKCGADLKKQANQLHYAGIELKGRWNDVKLMHYVTDPERSHDPLQLVKTLLGIDLEAAPEAASTGSLFDDEPEEDNSARLKEAAAMVLLSNKLRENLPDFYDKMEEPLSKVLAGMERDGVKVDLGQIRDFADGLRREIAIREDHIREMAGDHTLNISSPKQVGDLLFDKLKLDPKAQKSSRGQYSTDEATLLEIADRHPIVNEILEFRAASLSPPTFRRSMAESIPRSTRRLRQREGFPAPTPTCRTSPSGRKGARRFARPSSRVRRTGSSSVPIIPR